MKRISIAVGAAFALLASQAAFAADLAYTTSAANMRSGPTVAARIVATLGSNTEVRIDNCSGGWCFGRVGGRAGYISSSLLDFDGEAGPTVVERTYVEPEYVYPDTYYAGPSFYFGCCGPRWHGGWHHGWYHHGWRRW